MKSLSLHFDTPSSLQNRVSLKDWFLISQPSQSICRKNLTRSQIMQWAKPWAEGYGMHFLFVES